jgi:hypothetical protein
MVNSINGFLSKANYHFHVVLDRFFDLFRHNVLSSPKDVMNLLPRMVKVDLNEGTTTLRSGKTYPLNDLYDLVPGSDFKALSDRILELYRASISL